MSESAEIAQLFLNHKNWEDVQDLANSQGVLGFRTQSASKRSVRELVARLKNLSTSEVELLLAADRKEQALLLWLAVCRTYPFIAQFASEVLQEHFLSLRMAITYADFDQFFDAKAEWCPSLEKISATTRVKLRQVLFRMMREAEILSKDGTLVPVFLPPTLKESIISHDSKGLSYFPGAHNDLGVR